MYKRQFLYLLVSLFAEAPSLLAALASRTYHCRVTSELPIGAGLGSSAAYAVASSLAILLLRQHLSASLQPPSSAALDFACPSKAAREHVNQWAFVCETLIHGTPSGVDNTCSAFGGAVRFARGQPFAMIDPVPRMRFLITDTRVPKSTKLLVAGVAARLSAEPALYGGLLERIACRCHALLLQGEAPQGELEQMIDDNQRLLDALGVGHEAISQVAALTAARGLHTKLTGAGGGGCVITLLPQERGEEAVRELQQAIDEKGLGVSIETETNAPGVCGNIQL